MSFVLPVENQIKQRPYIYTKPVKPPLLQIQHYETYTSIKQTSASRLYFIPKILISSIYIQESRNEIQHQI